MEMSNTFVSTNSSTNGLNLLNITDHNSILESNNDQNILTPCIKIKTEVDAVTDIDQNDEEFDDDDDDDDEDEEDDDSENMSDQKVVNESQNIKKQRVSSKIQKPIVKPKESKEKREKISIKDKERLVRAHDEGSDYIDLGDKMGINRHTVHSIITLWRKSGVLSRGRVGGHKKHMITDELGAKLIEFVEQNPLHTLKEMKEFMETFNIRPTVQTISNYLHGKCIAIKKPELNIISDLNNDDIKEARYGYVKNILDNNISMKQCIFVDECVFNFWIRSPYGKYTKGTRDYKHCCGQKETNLTVCMAIATTGVVHYKVCYGPLNKTSFEEFVLELSMQLGDGHFYIIQESTPTHNSVVPAFENHQFVFLPPLSQFLNPLAGVFDQLKALVKTSVPLPPDVVKMSMTARKDMLKRIVEDVIPRNFYNSMNTHYSATVKFFSKCIFKEDIHLPE